MKRDAVALVLALVALAGCAVPVQPNVAPGDRAGGAAASPVFATELAGPSTFLAPMPTAVVLLKPDDLNRNRAFCRAFSSQLPTAQEALAESSVAPNLILTRWLVQLPSVPAGRAADCDFLVGTYDYARAGRLMAALRLSEGAVSGTGPFLVMVVTDASGMHVAGLDGSGYGEGDFGRFINAWGSALRQTQDSVGRGPDQPGVVRSVFNLVSAILRTVGGGVAGLIRGVVGGL